MSDNTLIARWESRGGAHVVELWKQAGSGYSYRATGAGGYLGNDISETDAIAQMVDRLPDFQPDANRTPMRRVV